MKTVERNFSKLPERIYISKKTGKIYGINEEETAMDFSKPLVGISLLHYWVYDLKGLRKQKDYTIPALLIPFIIAVIFELLMANKASAQVNYEKTSFGVASFHAGYSIKYNKPISGFSFGYRLNNIYASVGTLIALSNDATVPKVINSTIGYNIGQFQPFFSYSYQTIGKNAEAYFHGSNDEFSNGFKMGCGLSYYFTSMPLAITAGRYGRDNNISLTLYKSF